MVDPDWSCQGKCQETGQKTRKRLGVRGEGCSSCHDGPSSQGGLGGAVTDVAGAAAGLAGSVLQKQDL